MKAPGSLYRTRLCVEPYTLLQRQAYQLDPSRLIWLAAICSPRSPSGDLSTYLTLRFTLALCFPSLLPVEGHLKDPRIFLSWSLTLLSPLPPNGGPSAKVLVILEWVLILTFVSGALLEDYLKVWAVLLTRSLTLLFASAAHCLGDSPVILLGYSYQISSLCSFIGDSVTLSESPFSAASLEGCLENSPLNVIRVKQPSEGRYKHSPLDLCIQSAFRICSPSGGLSGRPGERCCRRASFRPLLTTT